jgi:hypothetical protein
MNRSGEKNLQRRRFVRLIQFLERFVAIAVGHEARNGGFDGTCLTKCLAPLLYTTQPPPSKSSVSGGNLHVGEPVCSLRVADSVRKAEVSAWLDSQLFLNLLQRHSLGFRNHRHHPYELENHHKSKE